MIIRKAVISDKRQLLNLFNEFDEYFTIHHLFSEKFLPFTKYKDKNKIFNEVVEDYIQKPEYYLFVAENNKELVGYICGSIKNIDCRVLDKEGSIEDWFVKEEWREKGVGKQLYDQLIDVFQKENCTHLGLRVFCANTDVIKMYHKMGFIDAELRMVKKL